MAQIASLMKLLLLSRSALEHFFISFPLPATFSWKQKASRLTYSVPTMMHVGVLLRLHIKLIYLTSTSTDLISEAHDGGLSSTTSTVGAQGWLGWLRPAHDAMTAAADDVASDHQ